MKVKCGRIVAYYDRGWRRRCQAPMDARGSGMNSSFPCSQRFCRSCSSSFASCRRKPMFGQTFRTLRRWRRPACAVMPRFSIRKATTIVADRDTPWEQFTRTRPGTFIIPSLSIANHAFSVMLPEKEAFTCFKNKKEVVRILVFFEDAPTFSPINRKLSPRPFELYG